MLSAVNRGSERLFLCGGTKELCSVSEQPATYRGTIKRIINDTHPKLRMMVFVALDGGYDGKAEDCMVIPSFMDKSIVPWNERDDGQIASREWGKLRVGQRMEFDGVERHPLGLRAINARVLTSGGN